MVETVNFGAVADHAHRWRIDEPDGPTSQGVCKACGTLRTFRNWLHETDFVTNVDLRNAGVATTYHARMEKMD